MVATLRRRTPLETYVTPLENPFQIIEQREPGEIIFSTSYFGIQRTGQLLIAHINAGNWRDKAAKQAIYGTLANKLAANPGLRPEDVQVITRARSGADSAAHAAGHPRSDRINSIQARYALTFRPNHLWGLDNHGSAHRSSLTVRQNTPFYMQTDVWLTTRYDRV